MRHASRALLFMCPSPFLFSSSNFLVFCWWVQDALSWRDVNVTGDSSSPSPFDRPALVVHTADAGAAAAVLGAYGAAPGGVPAGSASVHALDSATLRLADRTAGWRGPGGPDMVAMIHRVTMAQLGAKPAFEAFLNTTFPVRLYLAADGAAAAEPLAPALRPRETGGGGGTTGLPSEKELLEGALGDLTEAVKKVGVRGAGGVRVLVSKNKTQQLVVPPGAIPDGGTVLLLDFDGARGLPAWFSCALLWWGLPRWPSCLVLVCPAVVGVACGYPTATPPLQTRINTHTHAHTHTHTHRPMSRRGPSPSRVWPWETTRPMTAMTIGTSVWRPRTTRRGWRALATLPTDRWESKKQGSGESDGKALGRGKRDPYIALYLPPEVGREQRRPPPPRLVLKGNFAWCSGWYSAIDILPRAPPPPSFSLLISLSLVLICACSGS